MNPILKGLLSSLVLLSFWHSAASVTNLRNAAALHSLTESPRRLGKAQVCFSRRAVGWIGEGYLGYYISILRLL